jgi:hypothetical protein
MEQEMEDSSIEEEQEMDEEPTETESDVELALESTTEEAVHAKTETKKAKVKEVEVKREYVKPGSIMTETSFSMQTEEFHNWLTCITDVLGEANMTFNSSGLRVCMMDPANVALVKADYLDLSDYKPSEGVYGLNLNKLKSILRRGIVKGKDAVNKTELRFSDRLNIIMQTKTGGRTIQLQMPLLADIEVKVEHLETIGDTLKYTATVTGKASDFSEILLDSKLIADSVNLSIQDGTCYFEAQENSIKSHIDLPGNVTGTSKPSKYSLEYLERFDRHKEYDSVKIEFGENMPLRVSYAGKKSKVEYILAPRCEKN